MELTINISDEVMAAVKMLLSNSHIHGSNLDMDVEKYIEAEIQSRLNDLVGRSEKTRLVYLEKVMKYLPAAKQISLVESAEVLIGEEIQREKEIKVEK
jgi:hypothetical protein